MTSPRTSSPGGLAWLVFALAVGFCVAGLALANYLALVRRSERKPEPAG
jgi:hypothetical protein